MDHSEVAPDDQTPNFFDDVYDHLSGPEIRFSPFWLGAVILLCTVLVVTAGVLTEWYLYSYGTETVLQDLRHFNLNGEYSVPAWYSTMLLSLSAFLAALTSIFTVKAKQPFGFQWGFVAFCLLAMSVDEAAGFHETLIEPLRAIFNTTGALYFAWVIPAICALVLAAIVLFSFFLALPFLYKLLFGTSALLFFSGAVGMELTGGWLLTTHGEESLFYTGGYLVEEALEMIGLTVLLPSLLAYIRRQFPHARLITA